MGQIDEKMGVQEADLKATLVHIGSFVSEAQNSDIESLMNIGWALIENVEEVQRIMNEIQRLSISRNVSDKMI